MGLFDEVVGAFLKGDAGKYQAILSWVEEQGGIQVLLEKLQSGGLGAILSTWLSNQQGNQSVSGEQLESALGTNAVVRSRAKTWRGYQYSFQFTGRTIAEDY